MERSIATPIYDTDHLKPNFIQEILDSYQYRHLIWQLVLRNITTRYKRSFLGVAWSMLNPLGMMIVMTVVFSTIFGRDTDYRVYLLGGLLAWNFFSESTSAIIHNMIWGSSLLHKIYVPRTAFAISSVGTGMVSLFLALIPMLGLMLWVDVPITPAVLFTPISALLILMFTLGLGLTLAISALYFADVNEMFKVILRAWMYLTPIIYPENLLIRNGYGWLLKINPMYYLVRVFRAPFQTGFLPGWGDLLPAIIVSVVSLLFGWFLFTRYADDFTYRV